LIYPPSRNGSVRFDQFEVPEAARPTRRGLRAQAFVDYRPGGLDSFATPVARVHVTLDRHLGFPFRGCCTAIPHSRCMPDHTKCPTLLTLRFGGVPVRCRSLCAD